MTSKRCAIALTAMLLAVGCGSADDNGDPNITNNGSPNNGSPNNGSPNNGSTGETSNTNTSTTNDTTTNGHTNSTNNGSNTNNDTVVGEVSFVDDIAPLLQDTCRSCHGGGGNRTAFHIQGSDRTDTNAVRVALEGVETRAGVALVAPGDLENSELYLRVSGTRRGVMPPGAPLPSAEVDLIARWIEEGASFE